jgi:hypothetical protein
MTKEQECMKALQCLYLEVPSVIADDVKQKVIDALNEVKNCTIPDVSIALSGFMDWLWLNHNILTNADNNKIALEKYLATL